MALIGTLMVASSGTLVTFSTGDSGFRARTLALQNGGPGDLVVDLQSTGYHIAEGASIQLVGLGGVASFTATASTAGGAPELSFLAAR